MIKTKQPTTNGTADRIDLAMLAVHEMKQGLPATENNLKRLSHLHPETWQNPKPQSIYNMVVIGGGSAGLVTAIVAASLGAKV